MNTAQINKILLELYQAAIPIGIFISTDGPTKYIYSQETQEIIDFWESERLRIIKEELQSKQHLKQVKSSDTEL